MEKPFKDLDKKTAQLFKDAGLEKVSPHFKNKVMDAITVRPAPQKIYQPLITKQMWLLIAAGVAIIFLAVYLVPTESNTFKNPGLLINLDLDIEMPKFHISRIFTYAIGFLALFLIEIPFLKRYLLGKSN
jgi:hypothetical protein